MGNRFDPNRLRLECALAGVNEEATEVIVIRARDNLSFGVIAKKLEMKRSTVFSQYTTGTNRLREYYRRRAEESEPVVAAEEDGRAVTLDCEERPLTDREHTEALLRSIGRRNTHPPTPRFDELDREAKGPGPLVTVDDLLPHVQAGNARRAANLETRWERDPPVPGAKANPYQDERAKHCQGEKAKARRGG